MRVSLTPSVRNALATPGIAGIAIGVALREHRDLARREPPQFHQIVDDAVGLFGVARDDN